MYFSYTLKYHPIYNILRFKEIIWYVLMLVLLSISIMAVLSIYRVKPMTTIKTKDLINQRFKAGDISKADYQVLNQWFN